ncbi:hypothetical protein JEY59_25095, partial [Pseudomonas aeruginosa]|nr:hypothetical protein [Pseudomonas aeruginosa]
MSTQNSAYSAFSSLLAEAAMPVSPAELHGHLLGRVCAGAGVDEAAGPHAAAQQLGRA